jgi:diguanylate cyclase (GGDEF)-like protein/PAS domain S-box-containing protein
MEYTWHQALDSVHRLLVRYEETNKILTETEEKYRGILENALIGIFRIGPNGEPLIVNPAMAKICCYDCAEEMMAEVASIGEQTFVNQNQWHDFVHVLKTQGVQCGVEVELNVRNGARKWVQLSVRAVRDAKGGDRILHYEGTAEDVSERRRAEERTRQLAYFDPVTALPKRPLFEQRLTEALAAARWKNQRVAVLVVELGRFKMINDSLGRVFGDRLLQETSARIRASVGEMTVARLGGAVFAMILDDAGHDEKVKHAARSAMAAVTAEFSFMEHSLHITCTMGASLFPNDGRDGTSLVERAEVALETAKENGPNQIQFFSAEIDSQHRERLRMENGLRRALERSELYLVYQPQVDIRTGDVSGLEALLRWNHPEMGLVPPNKFIGVAESSGLIVPIGEWVLRTACAQARKWQDAGLPAVPVAVNVSAIQMRQQGFCELIRRVLAETRLRPEFLELELTEGLLLANEDVVSSLIQELRDMGVKLTIDDFGTGYSSLGYLRQFKVNRLKIDRSFVRDIPVNADDAAITTAIINMARALNLDVLAEGVETAEQLDFLRAQNCFSIQGYYFSKPVAVDKIEEHMQAAYFLNAPAANSTVVH